MNAECFRFSDDGDVPNHPEWPAIYYPRAIEPGSGDSAVAFETLFAANGWGNGWRNGIFSFIHYHSNAHECLGIAKGQAIVRLGGKGGMDFTLSPGDVVLLPAGTGHQLISSSDDLLVIGAYPPGADRDLMRSGEKDKQAIRQRVRAVPRPATGPIFGAGDPMLAAWNT